VVDPALEAAVAGRRERRSGLPVGRGQVVVKVFLLDGRELSGGVGEELELSRCRSVKKLERYRSCLQIRF